MKINAPEKIYLPYKDDRLIGIVKTEGVRFSSGVDGHIEYIRADAFIEKLECWLNEKGREYYGEFDESFLIEFNTSEEAVADFKNYMKGE